MFTQIHIEVNFVQIFRLHFCKRFLKGTNLKIFICWSDKSWLLAECKWKFWQWNINLAKSFFCLSKLFQSSGFSLTHSLNFIHYCHATKTALFYDMFIRPVYAKYKNWIEYRQLCTEDYLHESLMTFTLWHIDLMGKSN